MSVHRRLRSNCSGEAAVIDGREQGRPGTFGEALLVTGSRFLSSLKAGVVSSTGKIYFHVSPELELESTQLQSVNTGRFEPGIHSSQVVRVAAVQKKEFIDLVIGADDDLKTLCVGEGRGLISPRVVTAEHRKITSLSGAIADSGQYRIRCCALIRHVKFLCKTGLIQRGRCTDRQRAVIIKCGPESVGNLKSGIAR